MIGEEALVDPCVQPAVNRPHLQIVGAGLGKGLGPDRIVARVEAVKRDPGLGVIPRLSRAVDELDFVMSTEELREFDVAVGHKTLQEELLPAEGLEAK